MSALIELVNVWFRYDRGEWVLRGVNQQFNKKEVVLVIGKTGSGKSTLARAISGLYWLYDGELRGNVLLEGVDISNLGHAVIHRTISLVGQNPYFYFTEPLLADDLLSYAISIWGNENLAKRAVKKYVESMQISHLLDNYFFELSGGEARRALVAKSLISNSSVILFDEPLMWLDERGVNEFLKLIEALKFMGKTVIIFEHRFLPLIKNADRVLRLSNGNLSDVTDKLLPQLKEGPGPVYHVPHEDSGERGPSEAILRAVNVYHSYDRRPVLNNVNLDIGKHDFIVILGENGSGKTTLLRILAGYIKPKRGRVERLGRVVYIPQNILLFFTESSLEKEIEAVCREHQRRSGCENTALKILNDMGINPNASPFDLSHGQQVKVAVELSKLIKEVSVILLDEPFSGLTYLDRKQLVKGLASLDIAKVISVSRQDAVYEIPETARIYSLANGELARYRPSHPHALYPLSEELLKEIYG